MTHRDGLQRFSASTPLHEFAQHTTALRGFRLGARRAVMLEHHKRRATTPGAAGASPAYHSRGDTPLVPPGGLARPPFGSLFPPPRGSRGRPPHTLSGGHPPR